MQKTINCPLCGGVNLLPERKKSVFCNFCGSAIEAVVTENKDPAQSSIISKPEISKKKTGKKSMYITNFELDEQKNLRNKGHFVDTEVVIDEGGELSLIDRNVKSLDEITTWFSDNELYEIKTLNLSQNKINSLKGIERFQALKTLNLNNNEIFELPKENLFLKNLLRIYLSGNPIEQSITQSDSDYYSNIRFYTPKIKKITPLPDMFGDMKLSYNKLNINTVEEIADLYSEDELEIIRKINFSNNKIKTLKGLSDFVSTDINFSDNDLTLIDDLPKFKKKYSDNGTSLRLSFYNNKNLKRFTDKAINHFYDIKISDVTIRIEGCDNFDYDSLSKINFNQIFKTANSEFTQFVIYVDENVEMPQSLKQIGFVKGNSHWGLGYDYKKSGCFIATAAMGSYDHPLVMELRNFRDNWILEKKWGEGFVAWYYHYGAIAAKSIEKSFVLKKICCLFVVKPLVLLCRILKYTFNSGFKL